MAKTFDPVSEDKFYNEQGIQYFAMFNRIALAAGFIPSGMQKVLGEQPCCKERWRNN